MLPLLHECVELGRVFLNAGIAVLEKGFHRILSQPKERCAQLAVGIGEEVPDCPCCADYHRWFRILYGAHEGFRGHLSSAEDLAKLRVARQALAQDQGRVLHQTILARAEVGHQWGHNTV